MDTVHHDSLGIPGLLRQLGFMLNITRPLAAFDLETTGVNVETDRVVEITVGRVEPGTLETSVRRFLVNPGIAIPESASAIHGITDEHVHGEPRFRELALRIVELVQGADLVGFNHRRFDVRMLAAECQRVGLADPTQGARLVDVCRVFHTREPRDLSGALRFYCDDDHRDAHGTTPDVAATLRVLVAQFERYADLPRDLEQLHALNRDPSWVDQDGKFIWKNGEACVGFGKHAGVGLRLVDRGFLRWMLDKDFPDDTKRIAKDAMRGVYPVPPVPVEA